MSKTALFAAIRALDAEKVRALLDEKPELLSVLDPSGRNLLHLACGARTAKPRDRMRVVDLLLDRGMPIDTPFGRDKVTPLFIAVSHARDAALIKRLLARGASVQAAPGGGLFAAGWFDDVENLRILVDAGAKIDVVVGVTPFLASWLWKKFEAAKLLALRGADVNFRDRKGKTALHHGVEKNFDPKQLSWLVKHGASPDIEDNDGVTARLRASRKRDKRFLVALHT